ncbi:hypothetical protein TNIN_336881 [Trichonephila inaurata madagascariensis]|uniref:Uncharacterized protein n=1 Tax=Trichonephila inaurata madagascariensis TaxID=2747483 RepID=A0A8X6WLA4_9ARAC|nr:hypothetical protein TNIN_336881 [Trichonephila inaurata madagascariensis]
MHRRSSFPFHHGYKNILLPPLLHRKKRLSTKKESFDIFMPSCFTRIRETKAEHPEPRDKILLRILKHLFASSLPTRLRKLFFPIYLYKQKYWDIKTGEEREKTNRKTNSWRYFSLPRSKDVVRLSQRKEKEP